METQPRKIVIVKRPVRSTPSRSSECVSYTSRRKEEESPGCMCFCLGVGFGPIGLIVAAIIGKANGVRLALFGQFVFGVIMMIIYFVAKAVDSGALRFH